MEDISIDKNLAKKLIKKARELAVYTRFYCVTVDELALKLQIYLEINGDLEINQFSSYTNGYNTLKKFSDIHFYKWGFCSDKYRDVPQDTSKYYVELTHPYGRYIFDCREENYEFLGDLRFRYLKEIREKYNPIGENGSNRMLFKRENGIRLIHDYEEILKRYRKEGEKVTAEAKVKRLERQLAEEKAKAGIK